MYAVQRIKTYNCKLSYLLTYNITHIFQQTLKLAQSASQNLASRSDYHAIADRLTDTLNLEVIEPVLRVYRAYKHSKEAPHCQEHLMCVVNRHHDQDKQG